METALEELHQVTRDCISDLNNAEAHYSAKRIHEIAGLLTGKKHLQMIFKVIYFVRRIKKKSCSVLYKKREENI